GRLTGSDGNHASAGVGPLRMFHGNELQMVSWLLPAAALLAVAALIATWRRPRTDAERISLLVAAGSLAVSAGAFSLMGGIYHEYYTAALVPWIGMTIGLGVALVDRRIVAIAVAITSAWAWHILAQASTPDYRQLGQAI